MEICLQRLYCECLALVGKCLLININIEASWDLFKLEDENIQQYRKLAWDNLKHKLF